MDSNMVSKIWMPVRASKLTPKQQQKKKKKKKKKKNEKKKEKSLQWRDSWCWFLFAPFKNNQ